MSGTGSRNRDPRRAKGLPGDFDHQRRRLLAAGGGLVVFFTLPVLPAVAAEESPPRESPAAKENAAARAPARALSPSLKDWPYVDGWIRIDEHGAITVFTGKAELGQGVKTAFIQVAAEELGVTPGAINLVSADTARTANEGFTAGSHSMQDSGTAIRAAAAQVRALLVQATADKLGAPAEQLTLRDNTVVAPDGRRVSYGELAALLQLHVQADPDVKLKDPALYSVVGKAWPRVDIPAKVTGGAAYVQDMRLPGMVHGRAVRPPSYGARLRDVDSGPVEHMAGVLKVVRDGDYLAVIALHEHEAIVAMRALAAAARWDEEAALPDSGALAELYQHLPVEDRIDLDQTGPAPAAARSASARFSKPYIMHAAIGPSCAVAALNEQGLTVWTHTQGVFPLRNALAGLLEMPPDRVRCVHVEGSGCYGHNGADDVAADAALMARALPGRPVRVQWMRDQEHTWEPYGSAMVSQVRASLDAAGTIVGWQYEVWSNTHTQRPVAPGLLMQAAQLAKKLPLPPPKPIPMPEGDGDRNSIPLYAFANTRVVYHFVASMPLRVSALRSLGAYHNVFSIESFMDELAALAGADPVEFRLRHLRDERAREVVRTAAERFGWVGWKPRSPGAGRGFAFARYKNLGAYCAVALELQVQRERGTIHLGRVVAAVDSGQAVNPDGIRNQIEGAIVQSASWTLREAVAFDRHRITSIDWSGYPVLRFSDVPESIDVHILDRPGQPFLGTGEAGQGPTSAAIANGVVSAVGVRLRDLPLTPLVVRRALQS
jgi:nicotinate dehydrogenase subunit B